ncbi:putative peptidoglycan lipid II flippase [Rathayibacter tanaceti]|uniref:Peptidoglycan lipid II flippase n=2 Tax=Rathayibacter tanaceti TaxID=1671680 RepID=A0ACD2XGM3_9MICO|nr:putative peptidoglycan biosynthesis protein MviN [Rathayibacter tanaceti]TCO33928.1 putative peptidoglycan lipid II flippase [Rathayibacter tanaceti]
MVASFVSRILGFARLALLVVAIGSTSASVGGQVFEVANSAPTYLYGLIAGGVLGAVLVPQMVRARAAGPEGVRTLERLLTACLGGAALLTVACTLAAPAIVGLYAGAWSADWSLLATQMAYWCLPQIFFYVVFAVFSQLLNSAEKYGPGAWAPAFANLVSLLGIGAFLLAYPEAVTTPADGWTPAMVTLLCGSATAAIAAQGVIAAAFARAVGVRLRPRFGFGGLGGVSRDAVWVLLGALVAEASYVVVSNAATAAGQTMNRAGVDGPSLNSFSSAQLLLLLPHGILVVSVATAMFTPLSRDLHRGDRVAAATNLRRTEDSVLAVTLLSTVLFVGAAPLLTRFVFGTPVIGAVLQVLALSLVGFSQTYVLNRAMFALGRARDSLITQVLSALCVALGALVGGLLLGPELVVPAIALGTALGTTLSWAVARRLVRRHLGGVPPTAAQVRDRRSSLVAAAASICLAVPAGLLIEVPADRIAAAAMLVPTGLAIAAVFVIVHRVVGRRWLWSLLLGAP